MSPSRDRTPAPYPMGRLVRRALRGVIRAACPLDAGPKIPKIVDRVELQVRTLMQYMAPFTAWGLCLVFLLVDWSRVWRFKGLRPLHSLPRKVAVRATRALCHNKLRAVRELMLAVRATVGIVRRPSTAASTPQNRCGFQAAHCSTPGRPARLSLCRPR